MISIPRGCSLEVIWILKPWQLTMVIVPMLTSWNKPNYLPIRQWAFIKTSLRNANFFMGIFLRATSALCSLLYVWACEAWTCLFSGPMMIHLDLSTEFKFSHVHLFIAFSRRAVFCLFVCLFLLVLTTWLLIIGLFCPSPAEFSLPEWARIRLSWSLKGLTLES